MDFNYIIHPKTNKKIDLFSNDGLTILNQYITIFKFGGDGNFKLGYRTSRRHDKLYKIDKTLGRFHNITEKKGKKGIFTSIKKFISITIEKNQSSKKCKWSKTPKSKNNNNSNGNKK